MTSLLFSISLLNSIALYFNQMGIRFGGIQPASSGGHLKHHLWRILKLVNGKQFFEFPVSPFTFVPSCIIILGKTQQRFNFEGFVLFCLTNTWFSRTNSITEPVRQGLSCPYRLRHKLYICRLSKAKQFVLIGFYLNHLVNTLIVDK